jgi:hypothetical protein
MRFWSVKKQDNENMADKRIDRVENLSIITPPSECGF